MERQESGPDGGRTPALTGNWVCPRHPPMAPRPEPSTKEAILVPLVRSQVGIFAQVYCLVLRNGLGEGRNGAGTGDAGAVRARRGKAVGRGIALR